MSEDFEFYDGTRTADQTPRITVRKSVQLVLTEAAVAMLGDGTTHVQLGYNPDTTAVAIRPAAEGTKGRYRLRRQGTSSSRFVEGRRFFAHIGARFDETRTFEAEALGGDTVVFHLIEDEAEAETAASGREPRTRRKARAA